MALNSRKILIAAAAVAAVAAGALWWFTNQPAGGGAAVAGGTPAEMLVSGPLGEKSLGDPNAPNTVIEYASLTCSHCRTFHEETFEAFKEKYIDTGKVHFILREFPLDPLATAGIVVARCAPEEQFFPLVDLLFEKQREWAFSQNPSEALFNLVRQTGFTQESFRACLTNQEILDGVRWVQNRASKEFGVSSTPTFFINGKKAEGAQNLQQLDQALGG